MLYVCNVDEASAATGNEYVERVREAVKDEGAEVLVLAAQTEADIAELETYEERQMFLQDVGLEESGCNRLIKTAYKMLELETFITAGEMEVKAWTYHRGWKAPQCAGVIHTDFEKGFIRAEVIKYDDYIRLGSESAVRDAGLLHVEGKGIRGAGWRHHALPLQRVSAPHLYISITYIHHFVKTKSR